MTKLHEIMEAKKSNFMSQTHFNSEDWICTTFNSIHHLPYTMLEKVNYPLTRFCFVNNAQFN